MVLLGIDFGTKNIGLSIATGPLAEPLETISNNEKTMEHIRQICTRLQVRKMIIGISEGEMAKKTETFSLELKEALSIPIEFQDETLTSHTVKTKLHQANTKKKKRIGPDHAFAATEILQNYLDEHPSIE